jgi:hypothetical protein
VLFDSLLKTKYRLRITDKRAPFVTNCVTAVRYLLTHSSPYYLPKVFIGDMPRILVGCGCTVHRIKILEMKPGDLLFFKRVPSCQPQFEKQYIGHIAIALGAAQVFHSTWMRGGGDREDLSKPVDLYAKNLLDRSIDEPSLFLRYIDPRNQKQRDEFGADLIPFTIPKPMSQIEHKENESVS